VRKARGVVRHGFRVGEGFNPLVVDLLYSMQLLLKFPDVKLDDVRREVVRATTEILEAWEATESRSELAAVLGLRTSGGRPRAQSVADRQWGLALLVLAYRGNATMEEFAESCGVEKRTLERALRKHRTEAQRVLDTFAKSAEIVEVNRRATREQLTAARRDYIARFLAHDDSLQKWLSEERQ
jgi:hypothetical protein